MTDMLAAIEPKSDQINAEDLIGGDRIITVTGVQVRLGTEQPVSMTFAGSDKVFRPCKTVSRIIVKAWGPDTSQYVGRSLQLFRDPDVLWAGMKVGGIRVRAMSHIDGPLSLALAESKKARKITTVQPLKIELPREALTIEQARLDIEAAADIDALKAVWQRKDMKPHREALASLLERRKAALAEQPASPLDNILAHLAKKVRPLDVDALVQSREDELDAADRDRLYQAAASRKAEIVGAGE